MSLFRTTSTAVAPPQPPPPDDDETKTDTPPEDETDKDTSPETPTEAVMTFPDGTTMSAKQYDEIVANKARAELNDEWSRVRSMSTPESPTEPAPTTGTKPAWQVEVEDGEFQSDVEKSLVSSHNELGAEVGKISETVSETVGEVQKDVQALREEMMLARRQREIDEASQKYNVTEAEMDVIWKERGGRVDDIETLAELASHRKAESEANEEKRSSAMDERREAAAKISGGGNAQPIGGDPPPAGRGLSGKDIYDPAKIAAAYSAFK